MIEQSMDGLLFFRGGREVHACVAYNVTQISARMYSDGLGLLPIDFYVTFDNFRTIGRCKLAWRRRDHIGVVFERWVDVRADVAVSDCARLGRSLADLDRATGFAREKGRFNADHVVAVEYLQQVALDESRF
jgi:hypothetical protein